MVINISNTLNFFMGLIDFRMHICSLAVTRTGKSVLCCIDNILLQYPQHMMRSGDAANGSGRVFFERFISGIVIDDQEIETSSQFLADPSQN